TPALKASCAESRGCEAVATSRCDLNPGKDPELHLLTDLPKEPFGPEMSARPKRTARTDSTHRSRARVDSWIAKHDSRDPRAGQSDWTQRAGSCVNPALGAEARSPPICSCRYPLRWGRLARMRQRSSRATR